MRCPWSKQAPVFRRYRRGLHGGRGSGRHPGCCRCSRRASRVQRTPDPSGRGQARPRPGMSKQDYRIVYEIHDQVLLVLVIAVGHRRDIYRRLP
ncbi:MAG: type II toxin-antitoxin system RelE/ParE family toxin [Microlunatus sp.]